jgi:hypothetical protein
MDSFLVREIFFTTHTHCTSEQRTSLPTRQRRYKIVPSNRGTCVGSRPYGLRTRIVEPLSWLGRIPLGSRHYTLSRLLSLFCPSLFDYLCFVPPGWVYDGSEYTMNIYQSLIRHYILTYGWMKVRT